MPETRDQRDAVLRLEIKGRQPAGKRGAGLNQTGDENHRLKLLEALSMHGAALKAVTKKHFEIAGLKKSPLRCGNAKRKWLDQAAAWGI